MATIGGDTAAGEWLEGELKQLGFQTARQNFVAPGFSAESVTLTCGDAHADLIPQGPVITTAVEGLNAPLIAYPAWAAPPQAVRGAIAMIVIVITAVFPLFFSSYAAAGLPRRALLLSACSRGPRQVTRWDTCCSQRDRAGASVRAR